MKIIILSMGLFLLISFVSHNDTNCHRVGEIVGWDSSRCGCCQGWIIMVDEHNYLADSIPNAKKTFGPVENWKFPIPIYLDYTNAKHCPDRRIVITCIQKR